MMSILQYLLQISLQEMVKNMVPLLTVIIPVYNVQKYLEKCVDSVLSQSYTNIEILLIDDGSIDGSSAICDRLSLKDLRITIIHKENGGLSDARNTGIREAKGEYIAFLDSDDYIDQSAYEIMINKMIDMDLDILTAYPVSVFEDGHLIRDAKKRIISEIIMRGEDYLASCIESNNMLWAVQFNMYRSELVKKCFFKHGILHEDMLWTPKVFLNAKRVMCLDLEFYYYLKRENSITHNKNRKKNGIDLINTCYELEKSYLNIKNPKNKTIMMDNLVQIYLNGFYLARLSSEEIQREIKQEFLTGKAYSIKNKMKVMLFNISPNIYLLVNDITKIRI